MEIPPAILPEQPKKRPIQGRDELNLADFPISVLKYQQPKDVLGRKLDTVVYQASRYDSHIRQRVPQRVTLTTSSRYGLPTPIDEDVVLSLLCLGKRKNDFSSIKVHFIPHDLFRIMRWSGNANDYRRLRDSLRRLKALTIIYENAWWDGKGRSFDEELATGIISEYRLVHQNSGRTKLGELPPSWVQWTPRFHKNLESGNLKTLDLEKLFTLRLPTSKRMYRFLDKRFHNSDMLEMDLMDFACGHIGLTEVKNVAVIKQRLAPAIRELEGINFIEPTSPENRYKKIGRGIWRIVFSKKQSQPKSQQVLSGKVPALPTTPVHKLIAEFYRLWQGSEQCQPSRRELEHGNKFIQQYGLPKMELIMPTVIKILKEKWPSAKTFIALESYIPEAIERHDRQERRKTQHQDQMLRQQEEQKNNTEQSSARREFDAKWQPRWNQLPDAEKEAIRSNLITNNPFLTRIPSLLQFQCLQELAKQSNGDDAIC
jgi:Replication initiator protein A